MNINGRFSVCFTVSRFVQSMRKFYFEISAITLYNRIKVKHEEIVPRTIIIGGKAAPGAFEEQIALEQFVFILRLRRGKKDD